MLTVEGMKNCNFTLAALVKLAQTFQQTAKFFGRPLGSRNCSVLIILLITCNSFSWSGVHVNEFGLGEGMNDIL